MNYETVYQNLITKAQNRTITGYTERHHIIPKSIGGPNKKDNLVKLTAREHYVAHRLLVKMFEKLADKQAYKKMVYAMWFLSKTLTDQRKVTSRAYETARKAFGESNPNKDEDRKAKLRELHKSGAYDEAYAKKSADMKVTLSTLTTEEKQARMKAAHNCNQDARREAIRRGKASSILLTRPDGTTQLFWSYDDIRNITGKSYDSVKIAIRTRDGLLANGNRVQYVERYNTTNQHNNQKDDE